MHNAPVVYVPTQPEGNGLTLPTLLSVLAHGLVIGILVYTYQHTKTDTVESIETVMVSPEQLAEMQGQILANRAAAASAMQAETSTSSASSTSSSESFNDSASQPMLMSEEQNQRLLEQNQEYERNMAEFAAQLDESVTEEHSQVEQNKNEKLIEEQNQLGDFRNKQNNPPKITRPTATDKNLKINTGDSGSAGQRYDLEADGNSTTSNGGSSSTSGSTGASDSDIKALIKKNLISPEGAKGQTVLATLTITVDSSGIITGYNASGSNPKYNKALEDAARVTRKLPIGPDDPKYPTFSIEYIGTTK